MKLVISLVGDMPRKLVIKNNLFNFEKSVTRQSDYVGLITNPSMVPISITELEIHHFINLEIIT